MVSGAGTSSESATAFASAYPISATQRVASQSGSELLTLSHSALSSTTFAISPSEAFSRSFDRKGSGSIMSRGSTPSTVIR